MWFHLGTGGCGLVWTLVGVVMDHRKGRSPKVWCCVKRIWLFMTASDKPLLGKWVNMATSRTSIWSSRWLNSREVAAWNVPVGGACPERSLGVGLVQKDLWGWGLSRKISGGGAVGCVNHKVMVVSWVGEWVWPSG